MQYAVAYAVTYCLLVGSVDILGAHYVKETCVHHGLLQ